MACLGFTVCFSCVRFTVDRYIAVLHFGKEVTVGRC